MRRWHRVTSDSIIAPSNWNTAHSGGCRRSTTMKRSTGVGLSLLTIRTLWTWSLQSQWTSWHLWMRRASSQRYDAEQVNCCYKAGLEYLTNSFIYWKVRVPPNVHRCNIIRHTFNVATLTYHSSHLYIQLKCHRSTVTDLPTYNYLALYYYDILWICPLSANLLLFGTRVSQKTTDGFWWQYCICLVSCYKPVCHTCPVICWNRDIVVLWKR